MEVTHASDYDTHSIMGGKQHHEFQIINSAEFITVMSSTLYSNPKLAVAREVICNAWDAHKMVGKESMPIDITISDTNLKIRDYGPGIAPGDMVNIYCTYGSSTKKQQENQTGGFGLGAKSPFAISNHFTVIVNHEGTKTIYAISRGSEATKGMPDIREIISVPTIDSGIEVDIPIESSDRYDFENLCTEICKWGEINARLNLALVDQVSISKAENGMLFTTEVPYTTNGLLYIRYGNVVYPIPSHKEYEDLYKAASNILTLATKEDNNGYLYTSSSNVHAIFDAPANSISVTPSRESIHTSDRTIETVNNLLGSFIDECKLIGGTEWLLKQEAVWYDELIQAYDEPREFLVQDSIFKLKANRVSTHRYKHSYSRGVSKEMYSVKELVITMANNGHWTNKEYIEESKNQRLQYLINKKVPDYDLLIKFQKIVKKYPNYWSDHIYNSDNKHLLVNFNDLLRRAITKKLNPNNLIIWDRNGYSGRKSYGGQKLKVTQDNFTDFMKMTSRLILLVPDKQSIEAYDYLKERKPIPFYGCLVYVMSSNKYASYEETKRFFIKRGYAVIDLVPLYEKAKQKRLAKLREELEAKKTTGTLEPEVKVPKFKKPKNSYIALSSNLNESDTFNYRRHLDVDQKLLKYTTEPVAWFKPYITTEKAWNRAFFYFKDTVGSSIVRLIGDNTVILTRQKDIQEFKKKGIPAGEDYLVDFIVNELINNDNYQIVQSYQNIYKGLTGLNSYQIEDLRNTKTGKYIPEIPVLNEKEEDVINVLQHLNRYMHNLSQRNRRLINLMTSYYDSWRKNTVNNLLWDHFSEGFEQRLKAIDLSNIISLALNSGDPKMRVFAETLLSTTFYG